MKFLVLLVGCICGSSTFAANIKNILPIKHGIYVVNGTSCDEPASANLIGYYGNYVAPGHDTCSFESVHRNNQTIRAMMTCTDHQGGDQVQPATPWNFVVVDSENVVIGTQLGGPKSKFDYQLYTWCRASL